MARYRKAKKRSGGFFKSMRRKSQTSSGSNKILHVDAMLYGGLRNVIASKVTPMLNNILPQTAQYNDNIAMGLISYGASKFGGGMVRSVGQKGLIVENALVAMDLAQNIIPSGNAPSASSW